MAKQEKAAAPHSDRNEGGINFDAKAMLLEHGAKGTKIKYTDRMKIEYVKDTLYNKAGKVSHTSKIKGQALVAQGIAKEVKEDK